MSINSPNFFMREFSNEELVTLLITKVNELKKEKKQSVELNEKLQENLAQLEETMEQLDEAKRESQLQRDQLKEEVKVKAEKLLRYERLSAIGELSARIAHDLRNPLSVIKNNAELLRTEPGEMNAQTKSRWERHDRALDRIIHQVDDVLDFVRMTPLKKTNNSLSKILRDTTERVKIPKTVKIELPSNDISIPVDPQKLEAVFVNLLMNAMQAMNNVGKIIITISTNPNDEHFTLIKFTDTGSGISEKLLPRVFDPLFTTRQIGTGLGLPSCKNIIEQHGGTIEAKSPKGKGATFLILLPNKTEWEKVLEEDKKLTENSPV